MEDEILEESKLETLSKIIKRKNSRIKMLNQISLNSTLIRLNLLVSSQERSFQPNPDTPTSNFSLTLSNNVEIEQSVQEWEEKIESEQFVSDFLHLLLQKLPMNNDETHSVKEVCENFGINEVDLDCSDDDYQNLTTYKMFQQAYRLRIQSANPKVSQPKQMMLLAAKWREFQAAGAEAPEAEEEAEEEIESEIRSEFQIHSYIKTLLLSLIKTKLAEESEEIEKGLPVPEMTPRYLTRLEIRKRLVHEKGHKC